MAFKVVGFKMPQEMSDRIDECVAHLGVQRTAWVRNLLAKALEESGFPLDPKFLKTNQGQRTDMVSLEGRARAEAQLANARAARGKKKIKKLRMELGCGGSSGLIPARIDADAELRPLVPVSEPRERSRRKSA